MNLKSLYSFFASQKEATWIMQPDNVRRLFDFVKRNPIKKVLSLGTGIGCSDAVISLALKERGIDYQIDTLEPFQKCIDLAQKLIPDELKTNIRFHKIDPVVWNNEKIPYQYFSNFKEIPEGDYDLILVDGPGHFLEGENYLELPNGDVMKMLIEGKIKPGTLCIWDGRLNSLKPLERYYGDNFYLIQPSKGDLTILEKKSGDVIFRDEKKDTMKQAGYF